MSRRTNGTGRVINETLNQANYLRRQKSTKSGQQGPLMVGFNFFPTSNRDLVAVNDNFLKNFKTNEHELFPEETTSPQDGMSHESSPEEDSAKEDVKAIEY